MVKEKHNNKKIFSLPLILVSFLLGTFIALLLLLFLFLYYFEKRYSQKVYPGVRIEGIVVGGKTQEEIDQYFRQKSEPMQQLEIVLTFEDKTATLSGKELNASFDEKLLATQAYSVGRSRHLLSDIYQKWRAATVGINLPTSLRFNMDILTDTVNHLGDSIDITPEDALFQFEKGKVTLFKPSKTGRILDKQQTKQLVLSYITTISKQEVQSPQTVVINLPVKPALPTIATEYSNNFGIKELLGTGTSKFVGSIPGRVHNIELAASRINGHLVAPGEVFSFNDTLGDVSAGTGFQPAYIIKNGRTVLGDGGGVCQVSTTLFRTVLKSGLPIVERYAHAYRVGYYEQDSPPGLDATVFAPSYDLKFKNDTMQYVLIQAKTDLNTYSLTFDLYGTSDGRQVDITKPIISSQTPPPPDLYQDDPTLPRGAVKQVDWKAWGAKVNFNYNVTRNGQVVIQNTYYSNYQPWQAVFLKGTKE